MSFDQLAARIWADLGFPSGCFFLQPSRTRTGPHGPAVGPASDVMPVADALRDVSARGDIVFDLFGGSGSLLIAAHKTGRRFCKMWLDPKYCDIVIAR